MRGNLLAVYIAAASAPLVVLALIGLALTPGLVEWRAPVLWTRQVAGPVGSMDSMAADSSYVYAAGHVLIGSGKPRIGSCYFPVQPGGPSYYFLSKYDLSGNQIWIQHFGNPGVCDSAAGTAVARDAVYVAMSVNQTSVLRKYDGNGNFQWARQFGNLSNFDWEAHHFEPAPYIASVGADSSRVFIVGTTFLNNKYVGKVAGYDSDGKLLWASNLGSDEYYDPSVHAGPYPLSVYANSGEVYLALNLDNGSYVRKLDMNGVTQWSHGSADHIIGVSGDAGSIYTVARPSSGASGIVLSKLDLNGGPLWTVESNRPDGHDIQKDARISASSSGVYVTEDEIVVKYDGIGTRVWDVHQPLQASVPYALAATSDGVYVGGGLPAAAYAWGTQGTVSLSIIGSSSSLIFLGIGPPYSFITVAGLVGLSVAGALWIRRVRRNWIRMRRPENANNMRYGQPETVRK